MSLEEVRRWAIRVADRGADMCDRLEADADYSGDPNQIELYEQVEELAGMAQRAVELCNSMLGGSAARRMLDEFDDEDDEDEG